MTEQSGQLAISYGIQEGILDHLRGLDLWRSCWEESAVVIVGSSVRGLKDAFTDIDVLAFVPERRYGAVYDGYRSAFEEGRVAVLNPNAFLYDEFPLVEIPGIHGHYKVHTFEEVEARIRAYDDITMWIHGGAVILHDVMGRYRALQERARTYPEDVWKAKVRSHYLQAYNAAVTAANPLRRGDHPTVILTMTDCVAHLLRVCCLLERRPFPYDKWLYQEALNTEAGRELKPVFDVFFEEIRRPEICRIEPPSYERPGHRNADLEAYPLHMVWRRAKAYLDPRLPR